MPKGNARRYDRPTPYFPNWDTTAPWVEVRPRAEKATAADPAPMPANTASRFVEQKEKGSPITELDQEKINRPVAWFVPLTEKRIMRSINETKFFIGLPFPFIICNL
jgi:hypothetical protein